MNFLSFVKFFLIISGDYNNNFRTKRLHKKQTERNKNNGNGNTLEE